MYPMLDVGPDETGSGVGSDTVRAAVVVEERERILVGRGRFVLVDIVRARIGVLSSRSSSSSSQRALMRSGRVLRRPLIRGLGLGSTSTS